MATLFTSVRPQPFQPADIRREIADDRQQEDNGVQGNDELVLERAVATARTARARSGGWRQITGRTAPVPGQVVGAADHSGRDVVSEQLAKRKRQVGTVQLVTVVAGHAVRRTVEETARTEQQVVLVLHSR
uniref:Uncharacterized protein n=1 Tax=Anopheles merus TaxID=30066 RepID=A0A182UZ05_ANOME